MWDPLDSKHKCRNEIHEARVRLTDATGAGINEVKRKIQTLDHEELAQWYHKFVVQF
jgi:hypothetical protein